MAYIVKEDAVPHRGKGKPRDQIDQTRHLTRDEFIDHEAHSLERNKNLLSKRLDTEVAQVHGKRMHTRSNGGINLFSTDRIPTPPRKEAFRPFRRSDAELESLHPTGYVEARHHDIDIISSSKGMMDRFTPSKSTLESIPHFTRQPGIRMNRNGNTGYMSGFSPCEDQSPGKRMLLPTHTPHMAEGDKSPIPGFHGMNVPEQPWRPHAKPVEKEVWDPLRFKRDEKFRDVPHADGKRVFGSPVVEASFLVHGRLQEMDEVFGAQRLPGKKALTPAPGKNTYTVDTFAGFKNFGERDRERPPRGKRRVTDYD
jgi:hypothetical protein